MRFKKTLLCATLAMGYTQIATAQIPGLPSASPIPGAASAVPGGTIPPAPQPLGIAPYPAMPGEPTVWSKLGLSAAQMEYRRRQMCRTPGGQLIGRLVNPLSTLSGGLIQPFCPQTPSLAELMDPGAVGAAAKVKMDRAAAEDRMKAVKYLGSVDCHYWPEAEEALVAALRGDRNECVRYEAAVTLANGCCCTNKVIAALSHSVSCSDKDGFPSEKSARVRAAAANALDRCLPNCGCAPELPTIQEMTPAPVTPVVPEKKDEKKGLTKLGDPNYYKEYYNAVVAVPRDQMKRMGYKALEIGAQIGYVIVDEVNATDYKSAGIAETTQEANNLWDMFNRKGTSTAINNPMAPPISASQTAAPMLAGPTVSPQMLNRTATSSVAPAQNTPQPIQQAYQPVQQITPFPQIKQMKQELPAVDRSSASFMNDRGVTNPAVNAQPVKVAPVTTAPSPVVPATPVVAPKPVAKLPVVVPVQQPVKLPTPTVSTVFTMPEAPSAPLAKIPSVEAPAKSVVKEEIKTTMEKAVEKVPSKVEFKPLMPDATPVKLEAVLPVTQTLLPTFTAPPKPLFSKVAQPKPTLPLEPSPVNLADSLQQKVMPAQVVPAQPTFKTIPAPVIAAPVVPATQAVPTSTGPYKFPVPKLLNNAYPPEPTPLNAGYETDVRK